MSAVLGLATIYLGLTGLLVGSFLNVVVYRVPRGLSVVRPRSACPTCATPIAARDNVPVVAWFALRGRCRHCGSRISPRYVIVEAGTGLLFAASTLHFGLHLWLAAILVLESGLVALAQIDATHLTLPRSVVWPVVGLEAAIFTVAAIQEHDARRLLVASAAAVAWYVPFFLINLIAPSSLGYGDVRLVLALGLGLGWFGPGVVFVGFFSSNVLAIGVALAGLVRHRRTRSDPLPYGTYLAMGTVLALFVGPAIVGALGLPGLR